VVACYVGELYERGTIAPGTLQNYPTPINSVHALCQLNKPAVGPLLIAVRHGYAHFYADTHDGIRDKRAPLPAAVLLQMVQVGRTATDVALRRRMAGLDLPALTFARQGGGADLRLQYVTLQPTAMVIQISNYKHGTRAKRECLVIRIPRRSAGATNAAYGMVYDEVTAMKLAKSMTAQYLFTPLGNHTPLPTEVATMWMREGLSLTTVCAPSGARYSGHSLRAGAATSARCIGCSLDSIATIMGMKNKSTTTVSANYVDALAEPDAAAR